MTGDGRGRHVGGPEGRSGGGGHPPASAAKRTLPSSSDTILPPLPHRCGGCHRKWSGYRTCHCAAACHETFTSVTAFDRHRPDPAGCADPAAVGLVQVDRAGYQVWGWPDPGNPGNPRRPDDAGDGSSARGGARGTGWEQPDLSREGSAGSVAPEPPAGGGRR